jgi:hypothetical protein
VEREGNFGKRFFGFLVFWKILLIGKNSNLFYANIKRDML